MIHVISNKPSTHKSSYESKVNDFHDNQKVITQAEAEIGPENSMAQLRQPTHLRTMNDARSNAMNIQTPGNQYPKHPAVPVLSHNVQNSLSGNYTAIRDNNKNNINSQALLNPKVVRPFSEQREQVQHHRQLNIDSNIYN